MKTSDHYSITEYALDYCICDRNGCDICSKIERSVRTQNINVNDINTHNEVLHWMELPIIGSINTDYFYQTKKNRLYALIITNYL